MPGFLLSVNAKQTAFEKAEAELKFDERFECQRIIQTQCLKLSVNTYSEYPLQVFSFDESLVYFEGKIYNKTIKQVEEFCETLFCDEGFNQHIIEPWLRTADGEFVIVLINKNANKVLIFNDIFGRLPVYYHRQKDSIVLSREITFVKSMANEPVFNRFGVASTLIFGYVPGYKTIWEGILRLPYSSIILIDLEFFSVQFVEGERISIQNNDYQFNASVDRLYELLEEATINRVACLTNPALSLSGGLDSRLIAGILKNNKLEIPILTYDDIEGSAKADVHAVSKIINNLEMSQLHSIFALEKESFASKDLLLNIKKGLNYLGMSFLIPFLNQFKNNHLQQITGDGGDKIMANLMPFIPLRNEYEFFNYLISKNALVPIEKVLALTSLTKREFISEIDHVVNAYRAIDYEEKYALFQMQERAMVWLFEGEDRNRYFSWSTTPFYHPEFALAALSMPMCEKSRGKLFLKFFRKLGSQLETIQNPNWKLAPNQQNRLRILFLKQYFKHRLPKYLRPLKYKMASESASSIIQDKRDFDTAFPDWFKSELIDNELLGNEEFNWHLQTLVELSAKTPKL